MFGKTVPTLKLTTINGGSLKAIITDLIPIAGKGPLYVETLFQEINLKSQALIVAGPASGALIAKRLHEGLKSTREELIHIFGDKDVWDEYESQEKTVGNGLLWLQKVLNAYQPDLAMYDYKLNIEMNG